MATEPVWTPLNTTLFTNRDTAPLIGNLTALMVLLSDKSHTSHLLVDITPDQFNQIAALVDEHNLDVNNKVAIKLGILYAM